MEHETTVTDHDPLDWLALTQRVSMHLTIHYTHALFATVAASPLSHPITPTVSLTV